MRSENIAFKVKYTHMNWGGNSKGFFSHGYIFLNLLHHFDNKIVKIQPTLKEVSRVDEIMFCMSPKSV